MSTDKINETIALIRKLDGRSMAAVRNKLDHLTKPKGSLGILEETAVRLAGINRGEPTVENKTVIVMAGDHGIARQGVSAYPQEVTAKMVRSFLEGEGAVNVFARAAGARVVVVDMGIIEEIETQGRLDDFYIYRIMPGTCSIDEGPAMTREQAQRTVEVGIEVAEKEIKKGAGIIAAGEMGIGNTSIGSAILSVLSGLKVEKVIGPGTGVQGDALVKKTQLVKRAINLNLPNPGDPLDVLSKVGGLEIGGMLGVMLGAASAGVPVVVDGFVSSAAAMLAIEMAPLCRDYLFFSHLSAEPGHKAMLEWMDIRPLLQLDMCLGEGTGALLLFPIMDAAVKILSEMATFEEMNILSNEEIAQKEADAVVFKEFWGKKILK